MCEILILLQTHSVPLESTSPRLIQNTDTDPSHMVLDVAGRAAGSDGSFVFLLS